MDAGAFSDPKVKKAAQGLVLIKVDYTRKNARILQQYKVRSFPTVLFLNPDGKKVGKLGKRSATAVAGQFYQLKHRYTKK